mgnify:CR=1 FL=1
MDERLKARLGTIEGKLQDWEFPPQIVIELTAFCNFKCSHCNHKELERSKGTMKQELFEKLIDEIVAEAPATEIWPTFYGEAFILGDRLFERLRYARDRGAENLVLNSNGSLLHHKDWIDQILTSGLKRFILSLDGFSSQTFESIRVGGKRDEIYASVERLLERRAELGITYPVIQTQFSLMEENKHEFPQFKEHWESRGAEVKSRNMLSWTNSGSVVASNLDYDADFRIACPWGNNGMAIHFNGDVVTCPVDYEGRFVAGNAEHESIKSIWNGVLFEKVRKPHRDHDWDEIPVICQGCPDWQTAGATYHEDEAVKPKSFSRPFWHEDGQCAR